MKPKMAMLVIYGNSFLKFRTLPLIKDATAVAQTLFGTSFVKPHNDLT